MAPPAPVMPPAPPPPPLEAGEHAPANPVTTTAPNCRKPRRVALKSSRFSGSRSGTFDSRPDSRRMIPPERWRNRRLQIPEEPQRDQRSATQGSEGPNTDEKDFGQTPAKDLMGTRLPDLHWKIPAFATLRVLRAVYSPGLWIAAPTSAPPSPRRDILRRIRVNMCMSQLPMKLSNPPQRLN